MAWIELRESGNYVVCFRLNGQRFKRSLDTTDESDADSQRRRLEENIRLYERGRFDISKDVDVISYLLSESYISVTVEDVMRRQKPKLRMLAKGQGIRQTWSFEQHQGQ